MAVFQRAEDSQVDVSFDFDAFRFNGASPWKRPAYAVIRYCDPQLYIHKFAYMYTFIIARWL
jgi:hypothetical protein